MVHPQVIWPSARKRQAARRQASLAKVHLHEKFMKQEIKHADAREGLHCCKWRRNSRRFEREAESSLLSSRLLSSE